MIRAPRSDFWRTGLVPAPITSFLEAGPIPAVTWLPDPGPWRYLADPFGVQRGNATHVFVEAYDYRTRHGVIEHHEFGPDLAWRGARVALARPVHLSYPFLVEDGGETFMLPESHRAGELVLYRAQRFPDAWVRETVLLRDLPVAEASVIRHEDRWWMFFTLVGPGARDQRELHVAHADRLTGPWKLHPQNPVLVDRSGARPGGTPFHARDGALILPVQDCSRAYGGALGFVWISNLGPNSITTTRLGTQLTGDQFAPDLGDGCHTLAQCGALTLVDAKRTLRLWGRHWINLQRAWRRRTSPAA